MFPTPVLTGILETNSNLSLQQLPLFIEARYNERSAKDLCNSIRSVGQSLNGSVYLYVMVIMYVTYI